MQDSCVEGLRYCKHRESDIVCGYFGTTSCESNTHTSLLASVKFTASLGNETQNSRASHALSNHQHFPDVIAPQEELTRSKVFEQVLNMAIVEDPLQWETLNRLQLQRIRLNNVMPRISRFRAGIFHMKKCQKVPFGLQDICQML